MQATVARPRLVSERVSDQDLERTVNLKTYHQVDGLSISWNGSNVVLRGLSRSYYVKQLATHAVMGLVPNADVENAISVTSNN